MSRGGCNVLVVDDERALARNIQSYLAHHGYDARRAGSGEEALRQLRGGFSPAVILLDLRLPDADGIELLPHIRALAPTARTVIMTGYASVPTAVLAIKAGADDYLTKPIVLRELKDLVERVRGAAPAAPAAGGGAGAGDVGLAAILGEAPATRELRARVRQLLEVERRSGQTAPAVLVVGETGTGKGLVARALHLGSARAGGPFVELNCTAPPETLVEDQLFGREWDTAAPGGAREPRPGLIEAADGGTLLLDGVGDLGPGAQAKLLRFLEGRAARPPGVAEGGGTRVVAATDRPLEALVREGRFRADLYFRLRVVELRVPPLRERAPDILPLARAFLAESARRWRRPDLRLTPAAEARLAAHAWPGNVRELKNVVEQAAVMAAGDMIGPDDLGLAELGEPAPPAAAPPGGEASGRPGTELPPLGEAERELLLQALRRAAWNVSAAARLLGVSRDVVRYRMQKHGLLRPPA